MLPEMSWRFALKAGKNRGGSNTSDAQRTWTDLCVHLIPALVPHALMECFTTDYPINRAFRVTCESVQWPTLLLVIIRLGLYIVYNIFTAIKQKSQQALNIDIRAKLVWNRSTFAVVRVSTLLCETGASQTTCRKTIGKSLRKDNCRCSRGL